MSAAAPADLDGEFDDPFQFAPGPQGWSGAPQIFRGPAGKYFVAWGGGANATRMDAWAIPYDQVEGWGTPLAIESDDNGSAYPIGIASMSDGNATAVVAQSNGTDYHLWSGHYTPAAGWSDYTQLDAGASYGIGATAFGAATNGDAWLLWSGYNESSAMYELWARHHVPGAGWGGRFVLHQDSVWMSGISVAVEEDGNATAAWAWLSGFYAARYTNTTGWSPVVGLPAGAGPDRPQVVVDGHGNSTVAVSTHNGSATGISVTRSTNGGPWSAAQMIVPPQRSVNEYDVSTTGDGGVIVAWTQRVLAGPGSQYELACSRFVPGTGWTSPDVWPHSNSGGAPAVAGTEYGGATIVWNDFENTTGDLRWMRYVPGAGWTDVQRFSVGPPGNPYYPDVATMPPGGALAVWMHSNDSGPTIWSARFTMADVIPPVLTVDSPTDGAVLEAPVVWVNGTTEPGTNLTIGGVHVVVEANGSFGIAVALLPGNNTIVINATDAAGNSVQVIRLVSFRDPVPELRASLAAANATLAATQATLSSTVANLSDALARLSASEQNATELEAVLAVTEGALAAAVADVDALRALLADATATVDDLSLRIAALEAQGSGSAALQAELEAALAALSAATLSLSALEATTNLTSLPVTSLSARLRAAEQAASTEANRTAALEQAVDAAEARATAAEINATRANSQTQAQEVRSTLVTAIALIAMAAAVVAILLSRRKPREPVHESAGEANVAPAKGPKPPLRG